METVIKPLSEAVQSAVRSGFIISDLTSVVEELVYNSLDAGATKVSVHVGVNNGYVKVEDDGSGISREGLVLLGERYATSKLQHYHGDVTGSFGFRGEVLCSIADISLVEILTKVQGRLNGYRKVMKGRKCLYLSIDDDRKDVGTTIIVRDLFYNQPVRRRQMQSSAKKVLHSVKKCAVRIALVQPRVTFKVVDMESEDELLRTHTSSSPLSVLCSNFAIEASSLHELKASEGPLKLTGYVSAPSTSLPLKAVQYIYINSRFVSKGPIHKMLNRLADMCWDQLSDDKVGKRGQPHVGPAYCLTLSCPRSSYDLNLEFSRTSVEFKEWAPVLAFVEKSVACLWSKKKKNGEHYICEADRMEQNSEEKVVKKMTSVKEDWLLKTCETSRKRRRVQSIENDQASNTSFPYATEMQVQDESDSSFWQNIGGINTLKFGEQETKGRVINQTYPSKSGCVSLSDYSFDGKDSIGNHTWEPDNREDFLSSSRWNEELKSSEVGSEWSSENCQDHYKLKSDYDHKKLLRNRSWGYLVETQLDHGNNSEFEIDGYNAKRDFSNSIDTGEADVLSEGDALQSTEYQKGAASGWPLHKFDTEGETWKGLDIISKKSRDLPSFHEASDIEHTPESLYKRVRVSSSSCFSASTCHDSAISYPFFNREASELEHLVPDERLEWRSRRKHSDGFEQPCDGEKQFCLDLGDRNSYEDIPMASRLNQRLLFKHDNPGLGDVCEFSSDELGVGNVSPVRYGRFSSQEAFSPCMNRSEDDYRFLPAPSVSNNREVKMDRQRSPALGEEHISVERWGRSHYRCSPDGLFRWGRNHRWSSPDGLLSGRIHDSFADATFSPCMDLQSKLNTHGASVSYDLSGSVEKALNIGSQRCQFIEPNITFSEQSGRSYARSRRSQSAPPIYMGKRRVLSVMDLSLSTAETPAVKTAPQVCTMAERGELELISESPMFSSEDQQHKTDCTEDLRCELELTPELPLFSSEDLQHLKANCPEDSSFCVNRNVKGTSTIKQVSAGSEKNMTEMACLSPGYLKQVQDSESSLIKWREGCLDNRLDDTSTVGDRLKPSEDGNTILDIHSSMLHIAEDALVPKSINRNCLESAKVLLQVDNKFIPVVASGILAVVDQHAADERIRLEEMRRKVLSGEMKSISYLEEEKDLVLPEMAYQLLCNYTELIQHWGWICNIFSKDSGSFAKNLYLLNGQPTHLRLLAVPCIVGVNLSDADLLEFLEQLADTDGSSTVPPSVLRVLNYKACRGAIMFGDKLLLSECSLIVEELKQTSLCFQCAHGRPTTVPLVNLESLHKVIAQILSWHEESQNSWHGLSRKEISVERAKHRLDMARGE